MMVNIVDTFTRMYGRRPSEDETAAMMRMKAENDARKNKIIMPKDNSMNKSMECQKRAQEAAAKRPFQQSIVVPARVYTINKLMNYGLTNQQIGDALDLGIKQITTDIHKYKLPRKLLRKK